MKLTVKHLFLSVSVLGISGISTTGYAQTTAPQASEADSGEIIVTANKREESANKVGVTIAALSADMISERGITSLQDVAAAVPGLTYAPSANGTPIFTLRGVGYNDTSIGVYPAVSVYIDQQPLTFPVLASHSAYDLERIEVLKGPQGTLFGQNATGGAINYIAAKPTKEFEAGGDIGYGRFNQIQGNAYISGPISDNLRGRVAVTGLNADGWQNSVSRPGDTNGKQSYVAGRVLLDWDASDSIRFALNVNAWRDTSEPQAQQIVAYQPQVPSETLPQELTAPFSAGNPRIADWSTGEQSPRGNRRFLQTALRADVDISDSITLTSLSSYIAFKQNQVIDSDGSMLVLNDLEQDNAKVDTFSQELRLANTDSGPFRWIIGGNYESSKTNEDQILRYFDDSVNGPSNFFINSSGVVLHQDIRNYAFFGNAEYDVLSSVTLKGGIRYTNSRNNTNICGYVPSGDGNVAALFNILGTVPAFNPAGTPFTPIGIGSCYTLNSNANPNHVIPLNANGVPGFPFNGTLAENNVSWRAGVDYKLDDNTLLYLNVSKGYKAGSFPSLAAATFTQLAPVRQESVLAYEGGLKASLLDRRVQFNAAGFYYKYSNKQIRGKIGDPLFTILDALVNVPKSRIIGGEVDLTVRPTHGLTLQAAVTYLDSKIENYSGFNVLGQTVNFAGNPLPFTPKWNVGLNADYRLETANGGAVFVGTSVAYQSSSDAALGARSIQIPVSPVNRTLPGLVNPFVINARTTVDGRLGYEAEDGQWRVQIWGKNIFNKYYWTYANIANDSVFRTAGMPATYGITFGFKIR